MRRTSFWSPIVPIRSGSTPRPRNAATRHSGVAGLARQHADVNAELLERALVFMTDVGAEDEIGIGAAVQPAVALDLVFELARRPSGIAERQQRVAGPVAPGDPLEHVERCGEADAVVDRPSRILDEEIARMEHEAAARFDRSPFENRHRAGA